MIRGSALNEEQHKQLISIMNEDPWGNVIVDLNPILTDWEFLYDVDGETLWCGEALLKAVEEWHDRVTRGN